MGWIVGIIIGLMLLAAMSGPMGGPDDSWSIPPTTTTVAPNPGGGHCGYGPNDNDVRGIVHATASTEPHC